ncbi:hypothetical protein B0I73DRAFT_130508 [Yarrowia lipolytica]|nr:hypothetical protein BKA91DRAFT_131770 [Yarrowia lipolytica]KAE8173552.1 hypothetical protein BKA90DRAFT_135563 [Yarrowia lipolytica]RDW40309.1 hypothetical protein B0I73DRAFT_130508 [Yarrowia lipolytica]RDW54327.1 hypothetical protein B0I75DRAFT_134837 [Yarrowia lipolytica]RMJ00267.1 hypothetical protein BD777DRAFT_123033 [Yarrowia lipolytica]
MQECLQRAQTQITKTRGQQDKQRAVLFLFLHISLVSLGITLAVVRTLLSSSVNHIWLTPLVSSPLLCYLLLRNHDSPLRRRLTEPLVSPKKGNSQSVNLTSTVASCHF